MLLATSGWRANIALAAAFVEIQKLACGDISCRVSFIPNCAMPANMWQLQTSWLFCLHKERMAFVQERSRGVHA